MEKLKTIFLFNKKRNLILLTLGFYCCSLLLIRAKITNSIFLFFLIWNLFLAIIPYMISLVINHYTIDNKFMKIGILLSWLIFLPNSFYVITDFIHLSKSTIVWLDLLLMSAFAITSFSFGILSIKEIGTYLKKDGKQKLITFLIPTVCLLCGFGIYLGRILRFNSWNIISDPINLFTGIFSTLLTIEAILFSFHFGIFIYIFYQLNSLYHEKK
jgi:uncharacterized membrane protein